VVDATARFSWKAVLVAGVLGVIFGSLGGWYAGSSGLSAVGQRGQVPTPASSPIQPLGSPATSSRGNTITALGIDRARVNGEDYDRVEVQWCAGPQESGELSAIASLWTLRMDDGTVIAAVPGPVDDQSLLASGDLVVAAGDCVKGLVDFSARQGSQPAAVSFSGSETYIWALP